MSQFFDYINRWYTLSLECKDKLSKASTIEMFTQDMEWDLLYMLQNNKPWTFQELVNKTHVMEVTIANQRGNSFCFIESNKDKVEFKKNIEFSKKLNKETVFISASEPIRITRKLKLEDKNSASFKAGTNEHPTPKEFQEKKYPFL